MVEVLIHRIDKDVQMPSYAKRGDAAFDLRSAEDCIIKGGEKRLIRTGLRIAVPEGYAGLIWDRSGLAANHGLHCMAGVLDSGYRGEIRIVIKNLGDAEFTVEKNMRVAQMLIQPVASASIVEAEVIDEDTDRGSGGFGSSGLH